MILTCTGALSRNRRVGHGARTGPGATGGPRSRRSVTSRKASNASRAVKASAEDVSVVEMPITVAVAAILFDGLAPRDALGHLLARAPRYEH